MKKLLGTLLLVGCLAIVTLPLNVSQEQYDVVRKGDNMKG